jgi:hypothetical protein
VYVFVSVCVAGWLAGRGLCACICACVCVSECAHLAGWLAGGQAALMCVHECEGVGECVCVHVFVLGCLVGQG